MKCLTNTECKEWLADMGVTERRADWYRYSLRIEAPTEIHFTQQLSRELLTDRPGVGPRQLFDMKTKGLNYGAY